MNTCRINGVVVLNKDYNISSNKILQQVKRIYHAKKAGHTGSLDPLATGVLPICFGEATKFSQYLLDADKAYTAWGRLGYTSVTGDAEGDLCCIDNAPIVSRFSFEDILKTFIGTIKQIPPLYSALKKDGVPLYKLARKGQILDTHEMEKKARQVTIYDIQLNAYHYPDFEISVHCSKGTYIRTLIEDIGKSLYSGAYLLNLRRDKAGPYVLENSFTLEQLKSFIDKPEVLEKLLLPMDTAVMNYPSLVLEAEESKAIQQGKKLTKTETVSLEGLYRLYDTHNNFLGLGQISSEGWLTAKRLIATKFVSI